MSKSISILAASIGTLFLLASVRLHVQGPPQGPDMTVDAVTRAAVIDGVLKELTDFYVFPDVAARMAQGIKERREKNEYESITSAKQLAEMLTTHLRDVSHDKHLAVNY